MRLRRECFPVRQRGWWAAVLLFREEGMKDPSASGWRLSLMLVLLAAGSSLARGAQPTDPPESAGASAISAASAQWVASEIDTDGDTGKYASVAYDPVMRATYVSYYDATNQSLRIARDDRATSNCGPGEDWYCHSLDTAGADVGRYSSMAVRPAGSGMGIAYHDATNGTLKVLWFNNPHLWTHSIATIDKALPPTSITGLHTSLKYSSDGTPFIAYQFVNTGGADALMLASYVGSGGNCGYDAWAGQWQCDTIQTGQGVGQYASLALDGNGGKHIAYYNEDDGDLWYATWPPPPGSGANCGPGGNTWTCYRVDGSDADVGQYASIYVDDDNRYHIAYYDATHDELKYAVEADSRNGDCALGWAWCDTIDAMQADYHPLGISIAEDVAGYPMIAYQSEAGDLNLAQPVAAVGLPPGGGNCGQSLVYMWQCRVIDPRRSWPPPYRNGDYVSIAVNPAGLATIAYYRLYTDWSDGNLVVAYQQPFRVFLPMVMRNP